MDATLIVIENDAEHARALALVDRLWSSDDPADIARLRAQAQLIAAYEEERWPCRAPRMIDRLRYWLSQHGLAGCGA